MDDSLASVCRSSWASASTRYWMTTYGGCPQRAIVLTIYYFYIRSLIQAVNGSAKHIA